MFGSNFWSDARSRLPRAPNTRYGDICKPCGVRGWGQQRMGSQQKMGSGLESNHLLVRTRASILDLTPKMLFVGRQHVHPQTCRASETTHRLSAKPGFVEERRGPPRFLDRPLRACPGRTPRRISPSPCPITQEVLLPSMYSSTLGIRKDDRFRGRSPTARTFAYLRIANPISGIGARLATGSSGLTLSQAGFAPAGR